MVQPGEEDSRQRRRVRRSAAPLDGGAYGSLAEKDGKRILWYPDRKHFLLGKLIPDELLADMTIPGEREAAVA